MNQSTVQKDIMEPNSCGKCKVKVNVVRWWSTAGGYWGPPYWVCEKCGHCNLPNRTHVDFLGGPHENPDHTIGEL